MTPWVLRLLIANVAVYFLTASQPILGNYLALWPRAVIYQPWTAYTIVSYMFVHGGFWHLFWNMLGLFFFGPRLEMQLGGRPFLGLYLLSGLGGAAFSFLFAFNVPVVGASGAVFGVLLGFAYFWPREPIYIWGVFPIESRWLVLGLTAISLWSGISGGGGNIAHFAHLGGFAGGFAYLSWRKRKHFRQWNPVPTPKSQLRAAATRGSDTDALRRWKGIRVEDLHELNRDEVERVLAKATGSGIGTLTPEERALLDRFSTPH